jgi:hypothetical protein
MDLHIDLAADLNDQDDEGLGWSTMAEASEPAKIRPGVMLVAGNLQAQAVVRVVAVDDDGPGSRLFGGHSASPVQEGHTVRAFRARYILASASCSTRRFPRTRIVTQTVYRHQLQPSSKPALPR